MYSRSWGDRPLGTATPRVSEFAGIDDQSSFSFASAVPALSAPTLAAVMATAAPLAIHHFRSAICAAPFLIGNSTYQVPARPTLGLGQYNTAYTEVESASVTFAI